MSNEVDPNQVDAKTTAIEVTPPDQYTKLEMKYSLVKYVLPRMLVYSKDGTKFSRMHHEIKENIDAPYRVFTYDRVNGSRRWSLFVLFEKKSGESGHENTNNPNADNKFPVINFDGESLSATQIAFSDPPLHVLIKLLQVAYTRIGANSPGRNRFVGQDKCYIYARRNDDLGHFHKCLEMEVRGDIQNENIFYVEGHARTFALDSKLDPKYISSNVYFSTIPIKDDLILFNQVKRSAVRQFVAKPDSAPPLYKQSTFPGKRTTLDFHSIESAEDTEQTRGYLTDTFIRGFSSYLRDWDFRVEHIERSFTEFNVGEIPDFSFDFGKMDRVAVFDKRLANNHSLDRYLNQLRAFFPSVNFEVVQSLEEAGKSPTVVFQDCEAKAFKEGMPLYGRTDPHEDLYRRFPGTPKQFINVNPNGFSQTKKEGDGTAQTLTAEEYLEYDLVKFHKNQLAMIMNQLFIKDVILNERSVTASLPITSEYLFVHREHRIIKGAKRRFEVAMRFENDKIKFYDLINNPEDKRAYEEILETWKVSWEENYNKMVERRRGQEDGKDLPDFDVIVGPGVFVEIIGADEAILYDYEELIERFDDVANPCNIDELKLADHYDDIIDDPDLTEDMLEMWGYLRKQSKRGNRLRKPKNNTHRDAIQLYETLHEYDEFLDGLKGRYAGTISFLDLTRDEQLVPEIVRLFGSSTRLRNKYKAIDMFRGPRESDLVSIYTGIWYTQDQRYVVGANSPMNYTQHQAHRVRQFLAYQGSLSIDPMLAAMSVTFIRHNQYTVYPYYFHLIHVYIDNIARYKHTPVNLDTIDVPEEADDMLPPLL